MPSALPGDKKGGLLGLIIGGLLVYLIIHGIVHLTNTLYAKPEGGKPAAAVEVLGRAIHS